MSELADIIHAVKTDITEEQCIAVAARFQNAADAALVVMWTPRHKSEMKPDAWLSLREELAATLGASGLAEAAALLDTISADDIRPEFSRHGRAGMRAND